jgi:hypothetical protein
MVSTQVEVPEQGPDHPANAEPEPGEALSVTVDPGAKSALQAEPHEMPAGLLLTGPLPVPDFETVSL